MMETPMTDMTSSSRSRISGQPQISCACGHIHANGPNRDCAVHACPCQLHRDTGPSAMQQYSAGLIDMDELHRIVRMKREVLIGR
jgi:hypothetical protein